MSTENMIAEETFLSSEQVDQLIQALCSFQKEFEDVEKTGNNPFYKSTYVTKTALVTATRELLAKHGLVILQGMFGKDKVSTRIYHVSGQWIQTSLFQFPLTKQDPHAIASATTYFLRQELMAALYVGGIDDDGNAASTVESTAGKVDAPNSLIQRFIDSNNK